MPARDSGEDGSVRDSGDEGSATDSGDDGSVIDSEDDGSVRDSGDDVSVGDPDNISCCVSVCLGNVSGRSECAELSGVAGLTTCASGFGFLRVFTPSSSWVRF